jgi:CO/xanthine dehydrogenase Mo-binding subunit
VTETLNKEFSRKTFVKGGGALFVGFSLGGASLAGTATAEDSPYASNGPKALDQVDSFLVVHADNTVDVMPGGGEHGTGTSTGWLMLVAEELDMDLSQLRFITVDTRITPDQTSTGGPNGTKQIGPQMRAAGAYAKQALLGLASTNLGVPVSGLSVSKGVVSGGGKSVTYGDLIAGKRFNVTIPGAPRNRGEVGSKAPGLMQGTGPMKQPSQYKLVGTRVPRMDLPAFVTGAAVYINSVRVPGMLHGRIVLPRGQAGYGTGYKVVSVDESSIKHIEGARVVRKNDFIGVVAPTEYAAVQAAAQLKVKWEDPPTISSSGNLWKSMRDFDAAGKAPARYQTTPTGNVDAALGSAAQTVSSTYTYAYNTHGPIGPGCCIADVKPYGALIMLHTQHPTTATRPEVARTLGLSEDVVRVVVLPGSSHYGGAFERNMGELTAVMSQLAGAPVRLQLMRWDSHGYDNYCNASMMDIRGGVDAKGNIVGLDVTGFAFARTNGYTATSDQLLSGVPWGYGATSYFSGQESSVQYNVPNLRLTAKTVPLVGNYFKTSTMRSWPTGWAVILEQIGDPGAYAAKMDPIAFRRQNVTKTSDAYRFLGVLDAVAEASNWKPKVAASNFSNDNVVTGRGVAWGAYWSPLTYTAVVADVEVNKKTGKIAVKHIYAAHDQGLTVNPMGVENQIVGQNVMGTSRLLTEEIRFNTKRVTSLDWATYPIMRFKDTPKVTPIIVNRPEAAMGGAGDESIVNVGPAIANAFFDATGVRLRQTPFTPAKVRAALRAAGATA